MKAISEGSAASAVRPAAANAGFTLIELMIVVAIIAILASIAYASYQSFIIKSRRSAAQTCLMESAQLMERYYTTKLTYLAAPSPAGACITELNGFYAFSFSGTPDATSYTLRAVPDASRQPDTKCGTMTVNHTGAKTASASDCW